MRVCLIGYGYWGKNLARVFGKDLVGICDYDQDNLEKAKELYDVQYFSKWEDLYQSDLEYDTVAIATKADTHFELATTFLIADKNLWLEKPACIKTKDIEYLIKIRKGIKIGNFQYKSIKIIKKKSNKETIYEMELVEGKNREIRKIFSFLDLKVISLKRVSYGPFNLGNLKQSEYKKSNLAINDFLN